MHRSPLASSSLRVPAEWEPQSALWLAWPHNPDTWPGRIEPIPQLFVQWARLVVESLPVRILARGAVADHCRTSFGGALPSGVEIVDIPTNDCWIRDYGPTFVEETRSTTQSLRGVNWRYNAWGGKYPPWDLDDAAARQICQHIGIDCVDGGLCLEGGAIEVDGQGRMLTTGCLLSETRNPGLGKEAIARTLHEQLGVHEIVWIETDGLQGDDTDAHVDQLARFIDRHHVVVAACDDPADPN
jgi:agmatine deiminase